MQEMGNPRMKPGRPLGMATYGVKKKGKINDIYGRTQDQRNHKFFTDRVIRACGHPVDLGTQAPGDTPCTPEQCGGHDWRLSYEEAEQLYKFRSLYDGVLEGKPGHHSMLNEDGSFPDEYYADDGGLSLAEKRRKCVPWNEPAHVQGGVSRQQHEDLKQYKDELEKRIGEKEEEIKQLKEKVSEQEEQISTMSITGRLHQYTDAQLKEKLKQRLNIKSQKLLKDLVHQMRRNTPNTHVGQYVCTQGFESQPLGEEIEDEETE